MPEKPENWSSLSAEEKRKIRLDAWVSGEGIQFESPEAKAKYRERTTLFKDALELKKIPDRVPVAGLGGAFIYRRAGVPQKATMYDRWPEAVEAAVQFHRDYEPDSSAMLFLMSGRSMELLGQTNMKWAGCGLPDDVQYQFVEQEYMKADEYGHFLCDPTDYVLRRFLPRMYSNLTGLGKLTHFGSDGIQIGTRFIFPFLDTEVQKTLDIMKKAAELSLVSGKFMMEGMNRITAMGYPQLSTGFGAAPFDVLGDTLRGTRGIMMDLYRCPEKVIAASEKILELIPVPDVPLGASPLILMPLHKGDDTHISRKQFEKFYWPTFKQIMLDMIEEGLIPAPFAEGCYNQRLDYLTELPEASVLWFFDRTDMHKAKDVLKGHSCIMGNVPITLIATGTAEQVKDCCKDLIDYCGKDGGYILCSGTQLDDAKEETVRALIDFSKEYGVYK
ncbi:MAG: uroporphyrinogen decarboxylase [Acidobacteria bacterium]|nr:uroporphyrinogen decarboxylase [Acidobacteriota bacterium]